MLKYLLSPRNAKPRTFVATKYKAIHYRQEIRSLSRLAARNVTPYIVAEKCQALHVCRQRMRSCALSPRNAKPYRRHALVPRSAKPNRSVAGNAKLYIGAEKSLPLRGQEMWNLFGLSSQNTTAFTFVAEIYVAVHVRHQKMRKYVWSLRNAKPYPIVSGKCEALHVCCQKIRSIIGLSAENAELYIVAKKCDPLYVCRREDAKLYLCNVYLTLDKTSLLFNFPSFSFFLDIITECTRMVTRQHHS